MHRIRMRKVVVRVDIVLRQHHAAVARDARAGHTDLRGYRPIEVRVDHGQRQQLGVGGGDGRRAGEPGQQLDRLQRSRIAVAAHWNRRVGQRVANGRRGELRPHRLPTAMRHIHLEDVEGGRDRELVLLRQHQRVDAVDRLRHVGHSHLVRMLLEDVQRDAGQQRVAHGGLLRQVVLRAELRALAVPRTPLVHHQLHLRLARLLRVAHGRVVVSHHPLHDAGARQQIVELVRAELQRIALRKRRRAAGGVVVHRQAEQMPPLRIGVERLEQPPCPVHVVAVGADGDKARRHTGEARRPCGKAAEHGRILLRHQVAAAAPALVAHAPQVHVERLGIAIGRALRRQRIVYRLRGGVGGDRSRRRVAVLDLLVEVARRQRAHIRRQIRLAANGLAGVHELVQPILVRVLLPPEARARRAIGRRAQAVAPVVGVRKAAAGPAQHRRLHRLHGVDKGLANAARVGDLRIRAHPHAVVDHAAEVLDKVRVDLRRDGGDGLRGNDVDVRIDGRRGLREQPGPAQSERGSGQGGRLKGSATGDIHSPPKIPDAASISSPAAPDTQAERPEM